MAHSTLFRFFTLRSLFFSSNTVGRGLAEATAHKKEETFGLSVRITRGFVYGRGFRLFHEVEALVIMLARKGFGESWGRKKSYKSIWLTFGGIPTFLFI